MIQRQKKLDSRTKADFESALSLLSRNRVALRVPRLKNSFYDSPVNNTRVLKINFEISSYCKKEARPKKQRKISQFCWW